MAALHALLPDVLQLPKPEGLTAGAAFSAPGRCKPTLGPAALGSNPASGLSFPPFHSAALVSVQRMTQGQDSRQQPPPEPCWLQAAPGILRILSRCQLCKHRPPDNPSRDPWGEARALVLCRLLLPSCLPLQGLWSFISLPRDQKKLRAGICLGVPGVYPGVHGVYTVETRVSPRGA